MVTLTFLTVATGPSSSSITALQANATDVYWTHTDVSGGGVFYEPLDGGFGGADEPWEAAGSLSVGPAGVFWMEDLQAGDEICDLSGGSNCGIVSVGSLNVPLAQDAHDLYWVDGSDLLKLGLGGGILSTLATDLAASSPSGFATDSANVYWADSSSIKLVSVTGQNETTLVPDQTASFVAVDATNVYWTSGGSFSKMPLQGGPIVPLATGQTFSYVAIGATSFYWANTTEIQKVSLLGSGGASPVRLCTFESGLSPLGIAVSGSSVYWLNSESLMSVTPN